MSDQQVRDEVMTLIAAGHETTSNALCWTLLLLAQHPDIEARLREEYTRILGGRAVQIEDLPQLTLPRDTQRVSRRGEESPEKLAKTTEMCLPERKRVRKGGEEDDRSCRPHPGGPDELAEHAVLVWGSGCGGACAPAIRGPQSHPGARAVCARPDGQV